MRDLNLSHWLMLGNSKSSKSVINTGFVYLAVIFVCAYVANSLIN